MRLAGILLLFCFVCSSPALALTVDAPLHDTAQESRARTLFYELRCMVCSGESIADSPAEVARDMRRFVRERIAAGDDDAQIKNTLTARYGESVLMRPPLSPSTFILWLGPILMLLAGAALARRCFIKPRSTR